MDIFLKIIKIFCRDSVIFIMFQWTCLSISHLFWIACTSMCICFHLSRAAKFRKFDMLYVSMLGAWLPLHITAARLVNLFAAKRHPYPPVVEDSYLALMLSEPLLVLGHSVLNQYYYSHSQIWPLWRMITPISKSLRF